MQGSEGAGLSHILLDVLFYGILFAAFLYSIGAFQ